MKPFKFTVRHDPIPQPRQRHRVVWPKGAARMRFRALLKSVFVQNYTPANDPVRGFKAAARCAAESAYQGEPLDCPCRVDAIFVLPRHKSRFWKKKFMPRYPHVTKPDRDNLDKALLDALSGIIYVDDSRAFSGLTEKWHASGYEQPHVAVMITPYSESEF